MPIIVCAGPNSWKILKIIKNPFFLFFLLVQAGQQNSFISNTKAGAHVSLAGRTKNWLRGHASVRKSVSMEVRKEGRDCFEVAVVSGKMIIEVERNV